MFRLKGIKPNFNLSCQYFGNTENRLVNISLIRFVWNSEYGKFSAYEFQFVEEKEKPARILKDKPAKSDKSKLERTDKTKPRETQERIGESKPISVEDHIKSLEVLNSIVSFKE